MGVDTCSQSREGLTASVLMARKRAIESLIVGLFFSRGEQSSKDCHMREPSDPTCDERAVAQLFDCSVKTVQKWRQTGRGPTYVKVGRLVRYRQSDLQAWLDQQARTNTTQRAAAVASAT